jgi:hypothetical protein
MPYQIVWEPQGVYRVYLGDVTIAERQRSFDEICTDDRFDRLRYSITNYLGVGHYEVRADATEEIAAMHVGPLLTNPRIVLAAVAVDPPVVSAIRYFMALEFFDQPYELFSDVASARAWVQSATAQRRPSSG